MKLTINSFTVRLTSAVIAYANEPVFRHGGAEGILGAVATGIGAGALFYAAQFLPGKKVADEAKIGMTYRNLGDGLNVTDRIDAHNKAAGHFRKAAGWMIAAMGLGLAGAWGGYKLTKPHAKEWVEKNRQAKAVAYQSNFNPNENTAPFYKNAVSYLSSTEAYRCS